MGNNLGKNKNPTNPTEDAYQTALRNYLRRAGLVGGGRMVESIDAEKANPSVLWGMLAGAALKPFVGQLFGKAQEYIDRYNARGDFNAQKDFIPGKINQGGLEALSQNDRELLGYINQYYPEKIPENVRGLLLGDGTTPAAEQGTQTLPEATDMSLLKENWSLGDPYLDSMYERGRLGGNPDLWGGQTQEEIMRAFDVPSSENLGKGMEDVTKAANEELEKLLGKGLPLV